MIDYFSFTETRICNVFDILQTIPQKKKKRYLLSTIASEWNIKKEHNKT